MRIRSWSRLAPLALIAVALLAAACGRSGYQYVENDDDTVFIKIPEDWEVVSQGVVNFTISPDDEIRGIPGEFILPWRAEFDAAPASRAGSYDYVQGYVEVQPVDLRWQSTLRADQFFPDISSNPDVLEQVRHDLVTVGDVSGHRMAWKQVTADGDAFVSDRLVLVDSISSKVYQVTFVCTLGCYNANATQIDEIMSTFTVEG